MSGTAVTIMMDQKEEATMIAGEKHESFNFQWKKVSYSVVLPGKEKTVKTLLTNMSGSVSSGEVCAIMGGSGAGKSTLLSVLSGRVGPGGQLDGLVTLEGRERNPKTWIQEYSFVEQDDLMHSQLTVLETLTFSAKFRMPSSASLREISARVEEIIMDLGLNGVRNTAIGGEGLRGISGGERKRVSIGMEIITYPKLLILDEPTSGLDAFMAFNTLKMVKEMAQKRNIAVIMTLHQPRTDILDLLDKMLLLSSGKTLYFGETSLALDHFASLGYYLPPKVNPSDFFLDNISLDQRSPELLQTSLARIAKFDEAWRKVEPNYQENALAPVKSRRNLSRKETNSFFEFSTLLQRNLLIVRRDTVSAIAAIASSIFVSLLMGALFWQSDNSSKGIQNQVGALFFMSINLSFSNVIPMLSKFDLEKQISKRERSAGAYQSWTAFSSKWLANLPLTIISGLLFAVPLFFMVGFTITTGKVFVYLAIIVIHVTLASALGALISSAVASLNTATVIAPTVVTIFLLYGGPLVSLDLMPSWLKWFRYFSLISNSTGALLQNQFAGAVYKCPPPTAANPSSSICYPSGETVLEQFSLQNPSLWTDVAINCGLLGAFLILGAIAFERKSKPLVRLL